MSRASRVAAPPEKPAGKPRKPGAGRSKREEAFDEIDVPALHPEMRLITKIYDYESNPRTHPPHQLSLLVSLIKKYGFYTPIIVDENSVILAGHGRKTAAMMAGMHEVPVVVKRGLTEIEKSALRISDNQSGLLSDWDRTLIREEMTMLKMAGYEMGILGFGDAQLVAFTTTVGPPGEFGSYDENLEVDYECPRCHYKWSGKPNRGDDDE